MLKTSDFRYELPPELIAQTPLPQRDASRLLVLDRHWETLWHRRFTDIVDYLNAGDISGGQRQQGFSRPDSTVASRNPAAGVELLLLERLDDTRWRALVGGKRLNPGVIIELLDHDDQPTSLTAVIVKSLTGPVREIEFDRQTDDLLHILGHTPLPPYIRTQLNDPERYQTIYARPEGSAAAPTAGLHFTPDLLVSLRESGVLFETVTLHVGLDTFKPVDVENIARTRYPYRVGVHNRRPPPDALMRPN